MPWLIVSAVSLLADTFNQGMVAEDQASYNAVVVIAELEEEMREAAAKLEFERAAHLRDQIKQLQKEPSP